jgi:hypothetical protein
MNIHFTANPEGNMEMGSKGLILKMKEIRDITDQDTLKRLSGHSGTLLHIRGELKDLDLTVQLDKIVWDKNGTALTMTVETPIKEIDLNYVARMYLLPEPWEVRLSDLPTSQKTLEEAAKKFKTFLEENNATIEVHKAGGESIEGE